MSCTVNMGKRLMVLWLGTDYVEERVPLAVVFPLRRPKRMRPMGDVGNLDGWMSSENKNLATVCDVGVKCGRLMEATSQQVGKVDQRVGEGVWIAMLFPGLPPLSSPHISFSSSLSATPHAHFVKTGKKATQIQSQKSCKLTSTGFSSQRRAKLCVFHTAEKHAT